MSNCVYFVEIRKKEKSAFSSETLLSTHEIQSYIKKKQHKIKSYEGTKQKRGDTITIILSKIIRTINDNDNKHTKFYCY